MSTRHPVGDYLAILRASSTYGEAISAILEAYPGVTPGALRGALSRAGLESPMSYVNTPEPIDIPIEWEDPGPCPDPQPDRYWIDRQDTAGAKFQEGDGRPYYTDYPPLDLGKELERALIVADTHRPFHDKYAWATMLKAAKAFRPHTIIQLGDLWDAFCVSDHDKDPSRLMSVEDELKDVRVALDELDDLGAVRKVFTEGNHTYRLQRALTRHMPALLSTVNIKSLLSFEQRGWDFVPYREHKRLARVFVTHEAGRCGVHAAHQTGTDFNANVIFGHTHRLDVKYFGNVTGERHVSASMGWLGDEREAKYAHQSKRKDWQLGFGTMRIEKNGNIHLAAIPIVDRRCVIDGKTIALT